MDVAKEDPHEGLLDDARKRNRFQRGVGHDLIRPPNGPIDVRDTEALGKALDELSLLGWHVVEPGQVGVAGVEGLLQLEFVRLVPRFDRSGTLVQEVRPVDHRRRDSEVLEVEPVVDEESRAPVPQQILAGRLVPNTVDKRDVCHQRTSQSFSVVLQTSCARGLLPMAQGCCNQWSGGPSQLRRSSPAS